LGSISLVSNLCNDYRIEAAHITDYYLRLVMATIAAVKDCYSCRFKTNFQQFVAFSETNIMRLGWKISFAPPEIVMLYGYSLPF